MRNQKYIQFITLTTLVATSVWVVGPYARAQSQEVLTIPETAATSTNPLETIESLGSESTPETQTESSKIPTTTSEINTAPTTTATNANSSEPTTIPLPSLLVPNLVAPEPQKAEEGGVNDVETAIARMREHIREHNLPQVFIERLNTFEQNLKKNPDKKGKPERVFITDIPEKGNSKEPFAVLGGADTINKKNVTRDAYNKAQNTTKEQKVKKKRSLSLEGATLTTNTEAAMSLVSNIEAPTQTNTQSTVSSEFTILAHELEESQSIIDTAAKLNHNPLEILNFVRENIYYEPYYGSKKGADATLLEGMGNDADQAALLIALLRESNIPAQYRHGVVQLSLRTVMDLLGVDNYELAARVLGGANIPYALYYDENDNPLYFTMELFWVEAYIEQGVYGGALEPELTEKTWTPLVPALVPTYAFPPTDAVAGIETQGFTIQAFYDAYLEGDYGTATPITAFETIITDYIASQEGKIIEDAKIQTYRGYNALEFIPATLPFTITADYGSYTFMPDTLRHQVTVTVASTTQTFLSYTAYMSDLANRELLVIYIPATSDDATFLSSFNTIYDVVPLSLLNLKPVFSIQGEPMGMSAESTTLTAGSKATLGLTFEAPRRTISGTLSKNETEHVEKPTLIGNVEAIAIDSGNVMPPEIRPSEDVVSESVIQDQMLHKTALNYLDRLEASHDRLAEYVGGAFTDIATRAIVSNSLNVTSVNGLPYSFAWTGLSIDASALVRYHALFGKDVHHNRKTFTYLFGLQASLDEATIFEEDYDVDAVSTVKALRLINQGVIPGEVIKITQDNVFIIDTLSLSIRLKNTLYEAVNSGRIVYVPRAPFTYGLWSGTVYITLDPNSGSGSYVIGEGLNGGYTTSPFFKEAEDYFTKKKNYQLLASVTVSNSTPVTKKTSFFYDIKYFLKNILTGATTIVYTEKNKVDTQYVPTGTYVIKPNSNATLQDPESSSQSTVSVSGGIKLGPKNMTHEFDHLVDRHAKKYNIPSSILKVLITHESGLKPKAYRYEPCIDRNWYSGTNATVGLERHPEHHWRLRGYNQNKVFYEEGDQVSKLNPSVFEIIKVYSNKEIKYKTGDSLYDVWLNNNETQNYQAFGCIISNSLDSTDPQFLIAASYGLGQMLYETALNHGFDKAGITSDVSGIDIYNLFLPEVSIELAAKKLRSAYDNMPNEKKTNVGNECSYDLQAGTGKDWGEALRIYNGSASNVNARNYAYNRCKEYNSGEFDPY